MRLHGQPCSQRRRTSPRAGGCRKEVQLVGFLSLEAVGSPYKEAGTRMEEGPRVTALPPPLRRVLGTGTGLGSSATPQWEWEAGS